MKAIILALVLIGAAYIRFAMAILSVFCWGEETDKVRGVFGDVKGLMLHCCVHVNPFFGCQSKRTDESET